MSGICTSSYGEVEAWSSRVLRKSDEVWVIDWM
jgi:hypothetical protein